jgi:hypothetical protein
VGRPVTNSTWRPSPTRRGGGHDQLHQLPPPRREDLPAQATRATSPQVTVYKGALPEHSRRGKSRGGLAPEHLLEEAAHFEETAAPRVATAPGIEPETRKAGDLSSQWPFQAPLGTPGPGATAVRPASATQTPPQWIPWVASGWCPESFPTSTWWLVGLLGLATGGLGGLGE